MRRLAPMLFLALVAMVLLWRLGGGLLTEPVPAEVPTPGGAEDEATLEGQAPASAEREPESAPAPALPPDWAHALVTGRVVGPQGMPLRWSGAAAVGAMGTYGSGVAYRGAEADETGRFALHVRAGLSSVIVAGAYGHAVKVGPRVRLEAGESQDIGTLHLEPEQRLVVRVVDDAGDPVEDVDVHIDTERDPRPEGWEAALAASEVLSAKATDAEGRAVFDMLPAGTWRVSIDTGAKVTYDQVREHIETNGDEVVFVLPLTTAPDTLRVQLSVLGPDGEPVPCVTVRLESEACSNSDRWEAGDVGTFELECATGPVRLVVDEPKDANGLPLPYAPVVVSDVRPLPEPVVVRMEQSLTITGRVSWDGPPATWRIRAHGWFDAERGVCEPTYDRAEDGAALDFAATTEADGTFCLIGLPPGRYTLTARGEGHLRGKAPVVEAGAANVVLPMAEEGRIEVHVLSPHGLRFGSPYLALGEWVDEGLIGRSSWHGGGGDREDLRVFRVDDLRLDGRYRLTAWGTCSGIRCPAVVLDDVVPREAPYVLQLDDAPHVRGVVEREDGTPVWGAQVHHLAWPGGEFATNRFGSGPWVGFAMTDESGAFDLSGIGGDEVVLGVSGLGVVLRDPAPTLPSGSTGVRLVVVPARRISGRVTDPAGGVLDGLYAAAVPDEGVPGLWTPARVSADGFFEVGGLAPGSYRVAVWNDREAADERSAFSAAVPAGTRGIQLELARGAVLEGVVRDAAARPVAGATMRLLGRWTNRAEETDGEGRYRFVGIPTDAELEVEVVTPGGRSILRTVKATETARPTTLHVTLPER